MRQPSRDVGPGKDDSENTAQQPNELAKWIIDNHPFFELGTVYTVVAGLLNVLVICDAAGGPLIIRTPEKKKKGEEKEQPDEEGDL